MKRSSQTFLVAVAGLGLSVGAVASAQNLQARCDYFDTLLAKDDKASLSAGVAECKTIGNQLSNAFSREASLFVKERYLHTRGLLHQALAPKLSDANNRQVAYGEAFDCWQDYFGWFNRLDLKDRELLMQSKSTQKGDKIHSAAAFVGSNAWELEPGRLVDAWSRYESLDASCFGPDALMWWLATLLHPDSRARRVDDLIFQTDENLLKRHVAESTKVAHWRLFQTRLTELKGANRCLDCHRNFLKRLNKVMPAQLSANEP